MEIKRAKHAGFCFGVRRSIDMANEAIRTYGRDRVVAFGELVHNPQIIKELGIRVVNSINEIPEGVTAVITRAHGVPPEVIAAAEDKGLVVVDTTCQRVKKAQLAAQELDEMGRTVVIVGELGHPEVVGVQAYAGDNAIVVQSPEELPAFSDDVEIGVVSQTAQTAEVFCAVVDALKGPGIVPEVYDTRCNANKERQDAAIELAKRVDVMLVIGGPKSSNTANLAKISSEVCSTYLIQGPDDINSAWFDGVKSVGITAGASTPEDQIAAVEEYLRVMSSS